MKKKDNFQKAMYDTFGIGKEPAQEEENASYMMEEEPVSVAQAAVSDKPSYQAPSAPRYQTTILAEGSVFEGTLHSKSDVDLACTFKGDIFADGNVTLRRMYRGPM